MQYNEQQILDIIHAPYMTQQEKIAKLKQLQKSNEIDKELKKKIKFYIKQLQKEKTKKKNIYIFASISLLIGLMCVITGCFLSKSIEQTHVNNNKKEVFKFEDFYKVWNKKVYDIKYEYLYLKINFDKYELKSKDNKKVLEQVKSFIKFDKNKLNKLKQRLLSSKYKFKYQPIVAWIDEKLMIKYVDKKTFQNSYELEEYIANIVSPGRWFSNNTIDKIIQLNEFCYYFAKNKQRFYRRGFTKNIKNCSQFQSILDMDNINFKLK